MESTLTDEEVFLELKIWRDLIDCAIASVTLSRDNRLDDLASPTDVQNMLVSLPSNPTRHLDQVRHQRSGQDQDVENRFFRKYRIALLGQYLTEGTSKHTTLVRLFIRF